MIYAFNRIAWLCIACSFRNSLYGSLPGDNPAARRLAFYMRAAFGCAHLWIRRDKIK